MGSSTPVTVSIPGGTPQVCADLQSRDAGLSYVQSCNALPTENRVAVDVQPTLPAPQGDDPKNDARLKYNKYVIGTFWKKADEVVYELFLQLKDKTKEERVTACQNTSDLFSQINKRRNGLSKPLSPLDQSHVDSNLVADFCEDLWVEDSVDPTLGSLKNEARRLTEWNNKLEEAKDEEKNSRVQDQADYADGLGLTSNQLSSSSLVELDIDLDLDSSNPLVDLSDGMGGMYGENVTVQTQSGIVTANVGNGDEQFVVSKTVINIEGGEWVGDDEQALYVFGKIEVLFVNGVCVDIHLYPAENSASERDAVLLSNGNKVTDLALFGKVKRNASGSPALEEGRPIRELADNLVIGTNIDGWRWHLNTTFFDYNSPNLSDGNSASGDDDDDVINDLKEGSHVDSALCGTYQKTDRKTLLDMTVGILAYAQAKSDSSRTWSQKQSEAFSAELANLRRLQSSWDTVQTGDPKAVISKQQTYSPAFSKPPVDIAKSDKILAAYKKLTPPSKATEGNETQGHEAAPTPQASAQPAPVVQQPVQQQPQISFADVEQVVMDQLNAQGSTDEINRLKALKTSDNQSYVQQITSYYGQMLKSYNSSQQQGQTQPQ